MKRNKILKIFKSFELDTHIGSDMLNAIADKIIEADKQEKKQWFENNSDCYADTHELNYDTEPPVLVEGPVVQALTLKAFLKYPH
jgi:hypothetical protein